MDSFRYEGYVDRQYASCDTRTQRISVGWGDRYGAGLPEQYVDLGEVRSGVQPLPDGKYKLCPSVNPANSIFEGARRGENTGNNSNRACLIVSGGRLMPVQCDSTFPAQC